MEFSELRLKWKSFFEVFTQKKDYFTILLLALEFSELCLQRIAELAPKNCFYSSNSPVSCSTAVVSTIFLGT